MQIFWARLASFGHLGLISDLLIDSKFPNENHAPKGQENKIYTIVNGMETFYHRHTVPITCCSEDKYVLKKVILWKQGKGHLWSSSRDFRTYGKCSKIWTLVTYQKALDKQSRPRSDCFWRSSLIRIFPVCYSDKHFVNSSQKTNILFEYRNRKSLL